MRKLHQAALFTAIALTFAVGFPSHTTAEDWSPVVIARGTYRSKLQSMPIEKRPYRPLHVYGNVVRLNRERTSTVQPIGSVIVIARPLRILGIRP